MTTSPESKWTPGPYTVCWMKTATEKLGFHITAAPHGSLHPLAECRFPAAEIAGQVEANGNLFASAPDLYEALKKAMPFIDDALDVVEVMSESVLTKECREVVKLARAAIAKAEGR